MAGIFEVPENEIKLESFLKFTQFLSRLMFIEFESRSVDEEAASFKEICLIKSKAIYRHFMLFTLALAVASYVVNASINSDDLILTSQCILYAIACLQVLHKTISTLRAKKEILELFQVLRDLSGLRSSTNSSYNVKGYLDSYLQLMKLYASPYLVTFLTLVGLLFNFLLFGNMKVAVNLWYPFDLGIETTFFITIVWVILIAWSCSVHSLAMDSLLYGLITVIVMEFDILGMDFIEIMRKSSNERSIGFASICDRHNKLIGVSDELQRIYSQNFAFSFITSSLVLCFALFQLSVAENDPETYLIVVPFFGVVLGQTLLLCIFGQKLIDSSANVANEIFNSDWPDLVDIRSKKQLVLMIQRAQKEKRLQALSFVDLSLETYATIISTAYSYFTFMRNVYEGK